MNKFAEAAAEVDKRIADKRNRVLEKLDDPLFDDPEIRPYVTAILRAFLNGNGVRESQNPATPATKRLSNMKAIREAVHKLHFADPNHVTVNVVLSALETNKLKVSMKDEHRAVREALYKNPDFELVSKGQAGKESIYKRL